MINSIINSLNQIISEYIGNQDSNEIYDTINQNINNFFDSLCNNEEINFLIKNIQTDFQNKYYQKRDIIMLKHKIYMSEVNAFLNNNTLNKIEQSTIIKVLQILSNKIYTKFNKSLMNYITEEINNRKKSGMDAIIQNDLHNKIQNNFNNIYKDLLGEISETEKDNENENEEEKKSTQ